MSVARVTEISATNPESFEAAINEGVARATSTLRNVEGAWVKDMNVLISDNNIVGYRGVFFFPRSLTARRPERASPG